MTDAPDQPDYRSTVFLPRTDFPMKAGLAQQEPKWIDHWNRIDLYARQRAAAAGRDKFILHDGPPYANGDIHIGHALNKILKDVIVRAQQMMGKDAPYVPGWDCHGLPIEWKIEEQYRKKGRNKDEVDPVAFRAECRAYAQHWVGMQAVQFQRLGITGAWDRPYLTMDFKAEATIVEELLKFSMNGALYRGAKPVMWSPVEKTALAEAEVEYQDITSTQIDVTFRLTDVPRRPDLVGAHVVIWTTTPWTIPANRALAFGPDVEYVVVGSGAERFIIAADLMAATAARFTLPAGNDWPRLRGAELEGALAAHPWAGCYTDQTDFFDQPRPLLAGDFVTTDQGTGFVHLAPDHGEDDFALCKAHGIDPVFIVEGDGRYREDWPVVGGNHVYKVGAPDGPVCAALSEAGGLLAASADYHHSYPHSWRSKAKLIFRCTPQWFVAMDKALDDKGAGANAATLRQSAMAAIDETRWVPRQSKNRIEAMVRDRPDWVLSRQRAWGVPITVFVHRKTGALLRDDAVNARIVAAVEAGGADAWYTTSAQDFLGLEHDAADYERVEDILDVWFDSGSTHAFVLESGKWPELGQSDQADLYLEGSDQHRGWFQSSLLESCGTRGRAPYKAVMTHGFTLDAKGQKMSKSQGNTIEPQKVIDQYGADILRLWVCSTDYFEDVRIGDEILKGQVDAYRKLRNTLRFLLGALDGFSESERLDPAQFPELERWVLHRIVEVDTALRGHANDFDFNPYYRKLYDFCVADLSAFYFDIRKDSLYCDAPDALQRRACRTVLDMLFHHLTKWLAPILAFTSEEVWQSRFPDQDHSVHLEIWALPDAAWRDDALAKKWKRLREIRAVVTGALEVDRREKRIGASLEGYPTVYVEADDAALIGTLDFASLCITSALQTDTGPAPQSAFRMADIKGVAVTTGKAPGSKCSRCWQVLPEVGTQSDHPGLCIRCTEVVRGR